MSVAMAAADGGGTSTKQLCPDIQVTVRIKECPQSRNSIISKVAQNPQLFKLHNEVFSFDHIKWGDESQEQVYKAAGYTFVEKALQGQSVTILAYGPTGTGKSYTMGSLISNWQNSGLIQRCLKHIFQDNKVQVSASFVELYNKELHDLLNVGAIVQRGIAFNPKIEEIKSLDEGLQLVNRALQIRQEHQASTSLSEKTSTSQSHAWLTLHLKIQDGDKFLESKLNLVDLAGSRISTQTETGRYRFGAKSHFDESLSALNKVIAGSCSNRSDPMLSCKDNLLDAECLVSLVLCISADPVSDCRSAFRSLRVAENIKIVQNERRSAFDPTLATQLIHKIKDPPVATPPEQDIENIDNQAKTPEISLSEKNKMKKCTVVLKKSDVDLYENKKGVECPKNILVLNLNKEDIEHETIPLANAEAVYSAETKSTISISKLETQSFDCTKDNLSADQYNTSAMYYFDDNISVSSFDVVTTQKPSKFDTAGDDVSDSECHCAFHGFQSPMVFIPLSQSSSHESLEERENTLAANVSQLSINTGCETAVDPEYQGKKQGISRSEDVRNGIQTIEKQKALHSSITTKVTKLKRMNAILTTDFSEPGPSQIDNEIPRKIMKLDNENLASGSQRVTADLQPNPEDVNSDDDNNNNIENRVKELNDKQNAHNRHILRILNTCTAEQLTDLPRIGFKTAVSIYQYRLIHGEFESLESLENLPIWTEKLCKRFFAANNVHFE